MIFKPIRHQFVALDGLRGVAAILVLAYHAPDQTLRHWLPGSYLAVDLFFVLSGFVLGHAYQARFDGGMSARSFVTARLIRLYPLYLLGTLISLALIAVRLAIGSHPDLASRATVAAALLFLPAPDSVAAFDYLYPLNFPAWSLFFEVGINVVYAVLARYLTDRRLGIIVGIGAVLLVTTAATYGSLSVGYTWPLAAGGVGRVVFGFFAGIAVERLWRYQVWAKLKLPPLAGPAIVVAMFAVPLGPWRASFDIVFALAVVPLLILACARHEPSGWAARALAAGGTASFAIYALHAPVRNWLITLAPKLTGHQLSAYGTGGTLIFAALTIGSAIAADRLYDVPIRRATTAWLRPRADLT